MFRNRLSGRAATAAVCALLTLCAAPVRAGGFFIVGELPTGEGDPKDATLIVSVIGCSAPGEMSAKAEGLVDGKRVSLPLRLEPLGEGRFAIRRSWPEKGIWGISVYALSAEPYTFKGKAFHIRDAALFVCGADGRPELHPAPLQSQSGPRWFVKSQRVSPVPAQKAQEIDAALRAASEIPAASAVAAN